jgi:hypothetical protein
MFNKLRYTARVLSSSFPEKPDPCDTPDIVFETENPIEVSRVSRTIGSLIGIFLLGVVIGTATSSLAAAFPKLTTHGVTTISAIVGGLLAILWQNLIRDAHSKLEAHLKVGERIAPYFGYKIARTINLLKGSTVK